MSSVFNNFNTNVVNQVNGTLNIGSRDAEINSIKLQLDTIANFLNNEKFKPTEDVVNLKNAIEEIRRELASKSPQVDIVDKSLNVIERVSEFASLAIQIRNLLPF